MLQINETYDWKFHQLPLARIKKVMKLDDDAKSMMISGEAPIVFAKACEIFILELTLRSWIHTEENKRRTLQKGDVVSAISKQDIYDFLIDIVPRGDDVLTSSANSGSFPQSSAGEVTGKHMVDTDGPTDLFEHSSTPE
ncbi:Nuclear transcription factor Y subunit C-4 [Physocladia obscura]|uniref:Nuclear transcription factor Y subunit C-4 n=1 Tax=Physocladia obscura TaxID=109957 RepID=A0AAD5T5Q1_9FUNG|nr:Nuclear transcription factor Y subunit C-4 [Physocladia obscura]